MLNCVHRELLQTVYLGGAGLEARAEPAGFARQASPQDLDIRRELAQARMRGWTEQPHGWRAYSGGHMEEATVVAHHSAGGGSPGSRLP